MIYQIYFKDEQRGILEPQFIPFFNNHCTEYFENSVIANVISNSVPKRGPDEYYGILSYSLRTKIEQMKKYRKPFRNISEDSYNIDWLLDQIKKNEDVIFFMEHEPHNPLYAADEIHPNFSVHWRKIMLALGHNFIYGGVWEKVIYCNFFIAKHHVYKAYVDQLLIPAIKVMDEMPQLHEDAHYPKGPGYTYHSFICERLFSYWYNFIYKK